MIGAYRKKEKKIEAFHAKYMHITLQGISEYNHQYWLGKALDKYNAKAVLVGLEDNHGKGMHVHIMIQFTTKQKISRKSFIDWFGVENICIKTKPRKEDLLMALGYVAKCGNNIQHGEFEYRGQVIDKDFEVYRFNYVVSDIKSALKYFTDIICQSLDQDKIIERLWEQRNDIGIYLQQRPQLKRTLCELEEVHKSKFNKSKFKGFNFAEFCNDINKLKEAYKEYLQEYPEIFKLHLNIFSPCKALELDYGDYVDHDVQNIRIILHSLKEVEKYRYKRPHKTLNLFIWSSKASFGKTRLMNRLHELCSAYRLPDDEYYTTYRNNSFDILLSDEAARFVKSKDYSQLKQLLEGCSVEFNRKQQSKIIKSDNPLIILADNVSFDFLMTKYHQKDDYSKEVIESRILDLEIKSRATLHFIVDKCLIG